MHAIDVTGIQERELFKSALRTTLIKDHADVETFEQLFPLFFGVGTPPMQQAGGAGSNLSEQQQQQLSQAMQQLMQQLSQQLRDFLQRLMQGQPLSREELQQLAQQAG